MCAGRHGRLPGISATTHALHGFGLMLLHLPSLALMFPEPASLWTRPSLCNLSQSVTCPPSVCSAQTTPGNLWAGHALPQRRVHHCETRGARASNRGKQGLQGKQGSEGVAVVCNKRAGLELKVRALHFFLIAHFPHSWTYHPFPFRRAPRQQLAPAPASPSVSTV